MATQKKSSPRKYKTASVSKSKTQNKASLKARSKEKTASKHFHNYEIENARTVQDCGEIASVDTYSEEEEASGWHACLEDVFSGIDEVKFMGEIVKFAGLDLQKYTALVVIKRNGKIAKVSFDSIEWINPSPLQSLWHRAYLEYCN